MLQAFLVTAKVKSDSLQAALQRRAATRTVRRHRLIAAARATAISIVAWEANVSRSVVKAFVNQGTVPRRSTIAKLEAALA